MKRRDSPVLLALLLVMLVGAAGIAHAQVATLRTPGPEAEPSTAPEQVDGQEAILGFVACLREQGIDVPDPQFGPDGGVVGGETPDLDFFSKDFLDATEACQSHLEALQPELDVEQQAEQNEQLLVFAECMRNEGIDFPDPDPIRGLTIGSLRGEDGELLIDPFSSEFQAASSTCTALVGLDAPQVQN